MDALGKVASKGHHLKDRGFAILMYIRPQDGKFPKTLQYSIEGQIWRGKQRFWLYTMQKFKTVYRKL